MKKIIDLEIICQQTGDTVRNLKCQESQSYHEEDRLILSRDLSVNLYARSHHCHTCTEKYVSKDPSVLEHNVWVRNFSFH